MFLRACVSHSVRGGGGLCLAALSHVPSRRGLCPGGSLSRGVSVSGGLCPGGLPLSVR